MDYKCEIVEQQAQQTLSIRTRTSIGQLPQEIGKAFGSIFQYLGEIGEYPADVPFVAYYNMDMQDLDVEIGFPVAKTLQGKGEIQPSEIPGGKQASCLYVGPYNQIQQAYHALIDWMTENGYKPTGVAYEFYLNDPSQTPESELKTRVAFPIL